MVGGIGVVIVLIIIVAIILFILGILYFHSFLGGKPLMPTIPSALYRHIFTFLPEACEYCGEIRTGHFARSNHRFYFPRRSCATEDWEHRCRRGQCGRKTHLKYNWWFGVDTYGNKRRSARLLSFKRKKHSNS